MNKPPVFHLLIALLVLTGVQLPLRAQAQTDPTKDLVAVEQFLQLDDEQLDQLIAALTRLRQMTPQQRAALATEVVKFRSLPEDQRRKIRDGWGGGRGQGRPADPEAWREMMGSLTPQERLHIQQTLQATPPQERERFRQQVLADWREAGPKPSDSGIPKPEAQP